MSEITRVIVLPVTLNNPKRRADLSVTVSAVTTKEVSSEDLFELDKLVTTGKTVGHFYFVPDHTQAPDVPTESVDRDIKSQAQVIRNKCFRLHKKKEEAGEDSNYDALYRKATNWLIARLDQQIAEYD